MLVVMLTAVAVLHAAAPQQPPRVDSVRPRPGRDTTRRRNGVVIGPADSSRTIGLTPALEVSAYRDVGARALVSRARASRAIQDSALQSYRAAAYQRMSVGGRVRGLGRERLLARTETAMQIEWQRDVGARITVEGSRAAAPVVSPDVTPLPGLAIPAPSSIPYYPGRESLWPMGDLTDGKSGWTLWRHPLRQGAEAYYRYATGDSIDFTLPSGSRIRLVEIRLEPREPRSDLVAGSFWFDISSAQLVRALYRPSVRMDLRTRVELGDSIPFAFRGIALTMTALRPLAITVSSVAVEFALQEGRWWLPVRQAAEAEAQITFLRVPVHVEERFDYSAVNGLAALEPIVLEVASSSAPGDSTDIVRRRDARAEACRSADFSRSARRRSDSLIVEVRVPCDSITLMRSPALPASIFEPDDRPLAAAELELLRRTLGMRSQAGFAPARPTFAFGPGLARYNRVEGLSLGALARQELGGGFSVEATGRIGTADVRPRGELAIDRQDAFRSISVGGYERLAFANDWGDPLTFGSSLGAFLFGRDEGLYYRATGLELIGRGVEDAGFVWRLFAERHRDADVETHGSLAHALGGKRFRENIDAVAGDVLGAALRFSGTVGENPGRPRAFGDLRVESATGDFEYARAMLDATLTLPLARAVAAAVTAAGGTSVGELPVQRLWYLGGTHTIRGQPLGAAAGDAFWMGRAELGLGLTGVRTTMFVDLGWAGERTAWRSPGRPLSGAGAGVSFLDGMIRFDLARGVHPTRGWRGAFFLDARF
jgi:hypothetical protein